MANYVLEILDGDRAGEVLPLSDQTLRIGRKKGNDIVLPDEKTSGVHCEIAPEDDRLVLKDLGSTNGTFLDGKRVSEIVLTPGDVVKIGRTNVRFRSADDAAGAAAGADSGEFAVRTLDASRLQGRGGSRGLVAVLLVAALGAGGWYWWQGQQEGGGDAGGPAAQKTPLVVSGNKLDGAMASCESDEGWQLRVAGCGFAPAAPGHTGTGSFRASRQDVAEAADGATAQSADFAVMRLAKALPAFANRAFVVAAHCRTSDGARIAVRARAFAEAEDVPFSFCSGAALTACDGWQRIEAPVAIPAGCDRLQVEIVATLPSDEAVAYVDDVSVVEGGDAVPIELQLAESGQTAFGFGASLAVRSTDADNPATVLGVVPRDVPADAAGLHKAGYCVLSDLGATLSCTAGERSFALAATGADALVVQVPADAAGALLVAGEDDRFASASADSEFDGRSVLLGSHATRALLRFGAPTALRGRSGGGIYRLSCAASEVEVVLGFRAERQRAGEHLRQAEARRRDRQPGAALDELATLFATVPMDSEELAKAQALRGELLREQQARVSGLQEDLTQAAFFDTRGGYERVVLGVDTLVSHYGEDNLEDAAAVQQIRQTAQEKLDAIVGRTHEDQRARLNALAEAFGSNDKSGLEKAVRKYIEEHLGN